MVSKIEKSIEQSLPEGQLVNRAWLKARGFSRPWVDYALRSGKLVAVARGIYRKPGPQLKWQHVVYSLNEMGVFVHVGGRSALDLQGLSNYLPFGGIQRIDLYGSSRIPTWAMVFQTPFQFEGHSQRLFDTLPEDGVHPIPFGAWDWPIPYSTIELALLEFLSKVKNEVDFDQADKFFETALTLRPVLLRALLKACTQVKAKRLFLWFSNRHNHAWYQQLKTDDIDLGKGKRMLVKGGAYDANHQITVPRTMADGSEPSRY